MSKEEEVKRRLGAAFQEIAKHTVKECFLCERPIGFGRCIINGKPQKGAIYMRALLICPECNEQKIAEVTALLKGDRFNLGLFDL